MTKTGWSFVPAGTSQPLRGCLHATSHPQHLPHHSTPSPLVAFAAPLLLFAQSCRIAFVPHGNGFCKPSGRVVRRAELFCPQALRVRPPSIRYIETSAMSLHRRPGASPSPAAHALVCDRGRTRRGTDDSSNESNENLGQEENHRPQAKEEGQGQTKAKVKAEEKRLDTGSKRARPEEATKGGNSQPQGAGSRPAVHEGRVCVPSVHQAAAASS
jgi:hypothetical protein